MKTIPVSEAKAHLSHYGMLCYREPIVVTVNGVPLFQLVPVAEQDDDLIDQLLEHNPDFRKLVHAQARTKEVSASDAAKML